MAITDLQISEELQTGAPSIKYRGNEGPQAPMRMADADPLLVEEYEKYVFEMEEQGLQPISFEEFKRQAIAGYAYGGIAGLDGRRRYGIGSKLKKFARKIIPNEVADIAVKAAPFVAPFNPLAAGLMAGIGGFDQHGSISKGLKSGLMTYGMGQLGRKVGGAEMQTGWNPMGGMENMKYGLSKPYVQGEDIFSKTKERFFPGKGESIDATEILGKRMGDNTKRELGSVAGRIAETETKTGTNLAHKILKGMGMNTAAMAGIIGASALAGLYTAKNPGDDSIEQMRGSGMDVEGIRAEVIEAFKDPSGEKLAAIRTKYPFLGAQETKNIGIMAEGGRAGYYAGGQSIPSEYTVEDARKTAMQDKLGGITEVMKQADLYRQGDVGQMYMAEGGLMDLGGMEKDYRETGGFVDIGAKEKADDVPARLSVNEFVMTADAVRGSGDGEIDKGAERMEGLMEKLESKGKEENMKMAGPDWYIKRIEHLMFLGYDYDEAAEIAYDTEKYNEVIGSDPFARKQGASDMFEVSERLSEVV